MIGFVVALLGIASVGASGLLTARYIENGTPYERPYTTRVFVLMRGGVVVGIAGLALLLAGI